MCSKLSFIFLFLLFLNSCSSLKDEQIQFVEERIVIGFENSLVSTTYFWYSIDLDGGEPIYLFVDDLNNLVELNLKNNSLENVLKLPANNEEFGIRGGIWSPMKLENGNYLIEGSFQYLFINRRGEFLSKINISEKIIDELSKEYDIDPSGLYIRTNGGHFKSNDQIVVSICRSNKTDDNEYPNFPQFALITILENEEIAIEILGINYPKEILGNDYKYIGQAEIPNYYFNGDWIVYNFSSFRQVFFHNLKTDEDYVISFQPTDDIEDKSYPFGVIASKESIIYGFPLLDFEKDLFYRYHIIIDPANPMENKNYLCAFNFKGELLSQVFLGKNSERMLRNSVLIGDYVYMNNFFQSSDDQIEFSKFKLKE